MKQLLNKLIGFSLGPIIGAIITFITVPITTAFIVPEEFGKASMFTVVQSLITTFLYLGMDQSYTKEYNYVEDKKKLFQNSLIVPLVLTTLVSLLLIVFRSNFSMLLFETSEYKGISYLFSLLIIFIVIERFILLSIRMEEKAIEYSMYSIFVKVVILITTVLLLLIRKRDFFTIIYSNIFGQIFGDLFLFIRYREYLLFRIEKYDIKLIKKMFKFGYPIIIAASLTNLLNTLSRFFLRGFSTFHELGVYTAALKIAGVLSIVQITFTSFYVPMAYRWNKENKDIKYFNFMSQITLLFMTVLFFFIVFFKGFIVMILSSDYVEAEKIASLLALTPILYTLSETTTLGIVFSGKSYYNLFVSILSIIPALILNYILVPIFGTVGASISTATAYLVFCFSRTYFSRKNGFLINFKNQLWVSLVLYFVGIFNAFNFPYQTEFNIIMLVFTIFIQHKTFFLIKDTVINPHNWDFS